jgi:VWFA-related protein
VVVDVVVTGPDGAPVSGLTQPNFMVLEDRKPQSIHGFEVHTPQDDLNPLPPAPDDLPSHTFVNLERTPASGPAVVLLLDFLNTPIEDQMVAHEQILKFLEHKPASTEVAIFALGDRLSMVRGFTTDTARLLADMRSKTTGPRLTAAADQLQRAQTTLDAFLDIGTFLASVNGRKNLLWFSAAFDMMALPQAQDAQAGVLMVGSGVGNSVPAPAAGTSMTVPAVGIGDGEPASMMHGTINGDESLTVLTERLHRVAAALAVSQTAVYPIDVRGLMVEPGYSAALSDPSSMCRRRRERSPRRRLHTQLGETCRGKCLPACRATLILLIRSPRFMPRWRRLHRQRAAMRL